MKFTLFLILIVSNVYGFTIKGSVTDSIANSPLIGANVIVDGTNFGAATTSEGNYSIDLTSKGEYSITVSYMGYKTARRKIILENEDVIVLNIKISIPLTVVLDRPNSFLPLGH